MTELVPHRPSETMSAIMYAAGEADPSRVLAALDRLAERGYVIASKRQLLATHIAWTATIAATAMGLFHAVVERNPTDAVFAVAAVAMGIAIGAQVIAWRHPGSSQ